MSCFFLFILGVFSLRRVEPFFGKPTNPSYGQPVLAKNTTISVSVLDFGAIGDGKTDNTKAFQRGGNVIVDSPGLYKILGTLVVPERSVLQGSYKYVPTHITHPFDPDTGSSTLLAYSGKGDEFGTPFITLKSNSVLRGISVYYPEQRCPDEPPKNGLDTPPIPYPYSIESNDTHNIAIIDVEVINAYKLIMLNGASRHYVSGVQGQPLKYGVYVDSNLDIGRIENVHFYPYFCLEPGMFQWQKDNGVVFTFGRSDWEYVFNTFAYGYKIGYHFIDGPLGSTNGNFVGIGVDLATFASVYVERVQGEGILITNGEFTSFQTEFSSEIRIGKTNDGSVKIHNSAFWGPSVNNVHVEDGATGTISLNGCTFVSWDSEKKGNYSIQAHSSFIQVVGCEFQGSNNHIYLGENVEKAIVVANIFKTSDPMITDMSKKSQIGLNL